MITPPPTPVPSVMQQHVVAPLRGAVHELGERGDVRVVVEDDG